MENVQGIEKPIEVLLPDTSDFGPDDTHEYLSRHPTRFLLDQTFEMRDKLMLAQIAVEHNPLMLSLSLTQGATDLTPKDLGWLLLRGIEETIADGARDIVKGYDFEEGRADDA